MARHQPPLRLTALDVVFEAGGVTVWRVDVDAGEWQAPSVPLTAGEQARAARFTVDDARRQFVATRSALRLLLGRHLGVGPDRVELGNRPCRRCGEDHGKPIVVGPGRDGELDFSVAHTTGRALVAISGSGAVGVDIEPVQEHRDPLGLARRFFAPDDNRYLAGLPADRVDLAFSRMWCRKEAFLKLTGHGLTGGMAAVPVPGARWDGPVTDARGLADGPVRVTDLDPGPGYVAAVARSITSSP